MKLEFVTLIEQQVELDPEFLSNMSEETLSGLSFFTQYILLNLIGRKYKEELRECLD